MKTARYLLLPLLIVLAGFAVLPACAPITAAPIENVRDAAQATVNEANALIAAAANVISQNVADSTMTKAEAQGSLDKLVEYARKVDEAQALIGAGKEISAKSKAQLVHSLILALHREVAAKARTK